MHTVHCTAPMCSAGGVKAFSEHRLRKGLVLELHACTTILPSCEEMGVADEGAGGGQAHVCEHAHIVPTQCMHATSVMRVCLNFSVLCVLYVQFLCCSSMAR